MPEPKKEEKPTDEIQEVEYAPTSEISPTENIQQVDYQTEADRVAAQDAADIALAKSVAKRGAQVGVGAAKAGVDIGRGTANYALNAYRGFVESQKKKKMQAEAQNPQPVQKFGRHTIRPITEPMSPPQHPLMQRLQSQFYTQEPGFGMQAMMAQPSQNTMARFGGSQSIMERFGGSSNIMERFNAPMAKGRKMPKQAMTPMQKMMGYGVKPKMGKKGGMTAMQKVMGGGKMFAGSFTMFGKKRGKR